jgi:hypothetical protein
MEPLDHVTKPLALGAAVVLASAHKTEAPGSNPARVLGIRCKIIALIIAMMLCIMTLRLVFDVDNIVE